MELDVWNKFDEDNAVLKFDNLTVQTPEEKSWWRKQIKPKSLVLNSGHFHEGDFVAVIGPSGAGKTTLLVSLGGKCKMPSSGRVTVNGGNVTKIRQGVVEIVPQFDVFMDCLTVKEHLRFMVEMKLGSWRNKTNHNILSSLLRELKLKAHEDTQIRTLSGGEKRLLSLASYLLSDPQILICDEPTTGLDSYTACVVIGVLKRLALTGKIVICSVHQPSSDLFQEFNSVLLMAEGRLLFQGSQEDCKSLFESLNLHCPKHYNPAEFYMGAVSGSTGKGNACVEKISETFRRRKCVETGPEAATVKKQIESKLIRRHWIKQVQILLWRSSLTMKRDVIDHIAQLFLRLLISSMVLSACYMGVTGTTQRGVQDMRGFLWMITSEVSYSLSYFSLFEFGGDITLFKKEVGLYQTSAFFMAKLLSMIPRCIIWPVSSVILVTFVIEFPNQILTSFEFMAALIVGAIGATAYGLAMGAMFTSSGVMGEIMPCVDLPLALMSGAFLRILSLPAWWFPVKYISHFYYTMDAVSNIYWTQIDSIDCPSNSTEMCVRDGLSVLAENGYSQDFVLQDGVGLSCLVLLWSTLGYFGLRREKNMGYVY